MYVVYDLETTTILKQTINIIYIAAQSLNLIGDNYVEPFVSLINPLNPISYYYVQQVTPFVDNGQRSSESTIIQHSTL
jgi:DNA polymerase III alpha subunit (gram-positive type)